MKRETVHTFLIILVILVVGYGASITLSPQPTSSAQQSPWSTCNPPCSEGSWCVSMNTMPGQEPSFQCLSNEVAPPPSLGGDSPWNIGSRVLEGGGGEGSSAWKVGDVQEQLNQVNNVLGELRRVEQYLKRAEL